MVFTLNFWTSVRYALGHEFEPRWRQTLFRTQAQHLCFIHNSVWFDTIICLSNLSCELWSRKLKIKEIYFKKKEPLKELWEPYSLRFRPKKTSLRKDQRLCCWCVCLRARRCSIAGYTHHLPWVFRLRHAQIQYEKLGRDTIALSEQFLVLGFFFGVGLVLFV